MISLLLAYLLDTNELKDFLYLPHTLAVVMSVPKSKKNNDENHNDNKNNNNDSNNNGDTSGQQLMLLSLTSTLVQEDSVFLCVPVMSLSTFAR